MVFLVMILLCFYAFKIVPNYYSNNHARLEINRTILTCLNQQIEVSVMNEHRYLDEKYDLSIEILNPLCICIFV